MTSTRMPAFRISLATELAYSSISGAMVRMRACTSNQLQGEYAKCSSNALRSARSPAGAFAQKRGMIAVHSSLHTREA